MLCPFFSPAVVHRASGFHTDTPFLRLASRMSEKCVRVRRKTANWTCTAHVRTIGTLHIGKFPPGPGFDRYGDDHSSNPLPRVSPGSASAPHCIGHRTPRRVSPPIRAAAVTVLEKCVVVNTYSFSRFCQVILAALVLLWHRSSDSPSEWHWNHTTVLIPADLPLLCRLESRRQMWARQLGITAMRFQSLVFGDGVWALTTPL